jgi:large subunit ribosomal protein L19
MHPSITKLEQSHYKPAIAQVQSGDTVRVHQRIREGNKQRIQVFEGVVIRTHRLGSVSATITVRRIASGVGVEKTYLLHSPNVDKVEIMRRAKVRRNFLSYLRERRGKSARLQEVPFDREAANVTPVKAEDIKEDPLATEELDVDETQDELNQVDESLDEVIKEENKEAAADDARETDGGGDESVVEQVEAEEKIDKPDSEN